MLHTSMELEQGMASLTEWPLHTLLETAEETVLITILLFLSWYSLSLYWFCFSFQRLHSIHLGLSDRLETAYVFTHFQYNIPMLL